MKENEKCPECGERTLEEHGEKQGDRYWWFCRTCGVVIDEEGDG